MPTQTVDFDAIKERQRLGWETGDYSRVGSTLQSMAERLVEAADVRSGQRIIDVACGQGNAAIAGARRFADATASITPPTCWPRGASAPRRNTSRSRSLRLMRSGCRSRTEPLIRAPRGRKAWAVLTYLLLADRPPSRRQIAELLFGDADDPLGALRWTLAELRRALGVRGLTGDPVATTLGDDVSVDVAATR